jgi:hypothetical protein
MNANVNASFNVKRLASRGDQSLDGAFGQIVQVRFDFQPPEMPNFV